MPALPLAVLLLGVLKEVEAGVEGRLRAEAGVPGLVWEKEAAWALIFERRWVIALGVTSVDDSCISVLSSVYLGEQG